MPTNRDESFVPLAPGAMPASARPDYRVTVMTHAENAQPFRPLGQAGSGAPLSLHDPSHEPRVDVQREGDRVTAIHIQCTCGQIIELACAYESAPKAQPAFSPAPAPVAPLPTAFEPAAPVLPPSPPPPVVPAPAPPPPAEALSAPESEMPAAAKAALKKPRAKGR